MNSHKRCRTAAGFLAAAFLLGSAVSPADEWRVGVGGNPARNGLSGDTGPSVAVRAWDTGLTAVIAQQAVIEGNVVAMARIQNLSDVLYGTVIVAHNLMTGDTLWTAGLPVDSPATDWRNRVSAIRDGKVYATRAGNTNASYVYALDAGTGAVLWRSEGLVTETSTEGATFAGNGDLVTTGVNSVLRISMTDGSTVWETPRTCPTSGGCDPVVSGERVYLWEAGFSGPVITAFDLTDGMRLFSSAGIGGGIIQQVAPFVGPDGTLYAPRTQNNPVTDFLVALRDTGSAFEELWRVPLGYVPFASFGVGPDGSVYSYSPSNRVVRLDPLTGTVLDSSDVIVSDFYQPRMAIDVAGRVFLTNGGFGQGAVYAFQDDLSLLWTEPVQNVNVGGPALGGGGFLIVCGVGTDVRAYRVDPLSVDGDRPEVSEYVLDQNYPNPFNGISNFSFTVPAQSFVSLKVYDLLGRDVATLASGSMPPGQYTRQWDAGNLPTGVYFYRLIATQAGTGTSFDEIRRLLILK